MKGGSLGFTSRLPHFGLEAGQGPGPDGGKYGRKYREARSAVFLIDTRVAGGVAAFLGGLVSSSAPALNRC